MTGGAPRRLPALLRWGLPRDPKATEHILGFVLTTVLTIVVTRAYLQAAGFPQIGGGGLHVAHVLWGGLAMAIAVVLALSFAGPVVRPFVAFFGGIGFGLFIDEVGKFLTSDNDYFFRPAPMIMYATLVTLVLAADVLHGRREHHPTEYVAAAADQAVSGLAGGFSPRRRAFAEEQLARAESRRADRGPTTWAERPRRTRCCAPSRPTRRRCPTRSRPRLFASARCSGRWRRGGGRRRPSPCCSSSWSR